MADTEVDDRGPSKRKLLFFYPTLAVIAAVVVSIAVSAGQDVKPQKSIAGGYDASGSPAALACLGPRVDVKQSGRFVSLTNTLSTLGGTLEVKDGHLTGDVKCVDGKKLPIDARAANGNLGGTLGGQPVTLTLKRDPPAAGTPKPYIPGSIAGEYKVSPRSECIGGLIDLSGDNPVKVDAGGTELGELSYSKGTIAGTIKCKRGGTAAVKGTAADRQLALTVGTQAVTATKQREVEKTFAAFFIAVAIVMLAARFLGMLFARFGQPRVMGEVTAGILLGPTLLGKVVPGRRGEHLPDRHHAVHRGGGQPRPDLLHVPRRARDRPGAAQGTRHARRGDLERQRHVRDAARDQRRRADLRAGRAGQAVPRVRAVHGRDDVDHRVPDPRPHPGGAADDQAPARCRRARVRRDGRRDRLVPDRARRQLSPRAVAVAACW